MSWISAAAAAAAAQSRRSHEQRHLNLFINSGSLPLCSLSELQKEITHLHRLLERAINLSPFHERHRSLSLFTFSRAPSVTPNINSTELCDANLRSL